MHLLSSQNTKLEKNYGKAADYLLTGLTLAPHTTSGYNTCEWATDGCRASCVLWFAGRRVIANVREAAKRRTRLFFENRNSFLCQLDEDIRKHIKKAAKLGLKPLIRLNVASDLDWREVVAKHPSCEFYDYTKSRQRMRDYLDGKLPPNYHITYSASENSSDSDIADFLSRGGNVAQVFDTRYVNKNNLDSLPETTKYAGGVFKVVDADLHDIRLPQVDGKGVVCGLRLKGTLAARARARKSGFAKK